MTLQHYVRHNADRGAEFPFEIYTLRWANGEHNQGSRGGVVRFLASSLEMAESKVTDLNNKEYSQYPTPEDFYSK